MNADLKKRLTSRKFLGGLALLVISIVLLSINMIDASQWVQLNIAVYGIYAGSNAISKFPEKSSTNGNSANGVSSK